MLLLPSGVYRLLRQSVEIIKRVCGVTLEAVKITTEVGCDRRSESLVGLYGIALRN
ncbi:hypothetical protein [Rosistilla ulvae]|uniref:hypothetical protein n=1 Tax=Rosistilla ulvae TaxID=1930277 RepID=UPI001C54E77E|nr:hypothetical protein [Rosistilla ulvae]